MTNHQSHHQPAVLTAQRGESEKDGLVSFRKQQQMLLSNTVKFCLTPHLTLNQQIGFYGTVSRRLRWIKV